MHVTIFFILFYLFIFYSILVNSKGAATTIQFELIYSFDFDYYFKMW